jgi:uncharacterized protein involved in exopolysaccharide biosynthesis
MPLKSTWTPASAQGSSAGQTQADPTPKTVNNNVLEDDTVALLREQIHALTQAQNDDQETLKQVLEQLAKLAVAQRS